MQMGECAVYNPMGPSHQQQIHFMQQKVRFEFFKWLDLVLTFSNIHVVHNF